MALLEISDTAVNADFQKKVKAARIKTCLQIVGEAETQGKEVLFQKRHDYAFAILKDPSLDLEAYSFAVAANPVITTQSSDGDIEFTVVSVFQDMAGVKNSEL
jgi:hypothetical protein